MKFLSSRRFAAFTALFLLLLLAARPAYPAGAAFQAAVPLTIDTFHVKIMPEYDKPASVLVIFNITLSPQVNLPAQMSVRIPAAAGKPNAVAWQLNGQGPYDLTYETNTSGDWTELKFSALSPEILIEYYDPTLAKTGDQRNFTFRWPADYPINNFSMQIQQPVKASNMTLRPDAGAGQVGSDGLTYFSVVAGKIGPGTTIEQSMSYNKPDESLTNPNTFLPAQSSQPVNSNTAGRVNSEQILPWVIGGVGLLLIAVGVLWYWRTGVAVRGAPAAARPRHATRESQNIRRATSTVPAAPASGEAAFCHQCGKKAAPGDVFCRACGTKLR